MKSFIGGIFGALTLVLLFTALWSSSPCQRVETAALPAKWVARVGALAAEPFSDNFDAEEQIAFADRMHQSMQNGLSVVFYNRDNHVLLCKTDPVVIMRDLGLLDHRDLLKTDVDLADTNKKLARESKYSQTTTPVTQQQATSMQEVKPLETPVKLEENEPAGGKRLIFWGILIALTIVILIKNDKLLPYLATLPGKIWQIHADLAKHLLPRKAVVPDGGKEATDKTGE